jgi:hypothetical protein
MASALPAKRVDGVDGGELRSSTSKSMDEVLRSGVCSVKGVVDIAR